MVAKQSQKTANDTKSIAFETRRDSTAMKTIASLTMIYLPSTFMATVFGTGFFNFGSNGSGKLLVNSEIWKFIVVAIVLTLVTNSIWIWLNKFGAPSFFTWAASTVQLLDQLDVKQNSRHETNASKRAFKTARRSSRTTTINEVDHESVSRTQVLHRTLVAGATEQQRNGNEMV